MKTRCSFCKKKQQLILACKFCLKDVCTRCIQIEMHECVNMSKCVELQKLQLKNKLYNEQVVKLKIEPI